MLRHSGKDDGYRGACHRAAQRAGPLAPPILRAVAALADEAIE